MKFNKNIVVQQISEYLLTPKLCLKSKEGELFCEDKLLAQNIRDIFSNNQKIIVNLGDRTTKIFDTETLNEYHLKSNRAVNTFFAPQNTWIFIDSENSNSLSIWDLNTKVGKLISTIYDWEFTTIKDNKVFFIKFPELIAKSLSLETGEYLWETNIEIEGDSDPRIKQVLGISEDVLVVFTFGSTLVGIDVHAGKILWSILPKGFYPSGFTGMAWCWHLEDGYLYLLRHQYYLRINLSNQQLEILWQVPADTLEFEDCSYTEDHIYFMAIKKKSNIFNTSILGVFDRKALKIVWQHDQPIYSSQPPQSDGNKLYCLDMGGTLHIFEKEV